MVRESADSAAPPNKIHLKYSRLKSSCAIARRLHFLSY